MFRMRSRFYKKDDLVFISHLDLVRVFERAMRRGNIPISYSQGFNPHPIMAFATALGIGVSSEGEYIDVQLDKQMEPEEFMNKLNSVLPEGLRLIQSAYIASSEDSLMSVIKRSVYVVKAKMTGSVAKEELESKVKHFLSLTEIIETKEKKKKHKNDKPKFQESNIREGINLLDILSFENNEIILKMNLAAGSEKNLKPEIVIRKIAEITELPINLESVRVHRLELLKEQTGDFVSIMEGVKSI